MTSFRPRLIKIQAEQEINNLTVYSRSMTINLEARLERKKGGVFYTPDDLCDFIARNAISALLHGSVNVQYPPNTNPPSFEDLLSKATKPLLDKLRKEITQITILDPAVGDGAILLKVCDILFEFHSRLNGSSPSLAVVLKAEIIQKNIFGVDILEANVLKTQERLQQWAGESSENLSKKVMQETLAKNIRVGNSLVGQVKPPVLQGLQDGSPNPFHWFEAFPSVIQAGGFDIIVGNPPYGNLLSNGEKLALAEFETIGTGEVAAVFLERCLQLLRSEGQLALIIANSLAINARTAPARTLLRRHISASKIALFGTRPGRLFADAEIRAMLLFGKKDDPFFKGIDGVIYTTEARKFFQRDRRDVLRNLRYESTAGLELGKRSIGEGGVDLALPKIGFPATRRILQHLKGMSQNTVADCINKPECLETLEIRITGGYWLAALPEFPYRSSKIRQVRVRSSVERDLLLLVVNSSLFYIFWSTYGNLRDLKLSDLFKFPFPSQEKMLMCANTIHAIAQQLTTDLLATFEPFEARRGGRRGEFHPGQCKAILENVDEIICELYGFTDPDVDFIKEFDRHIRKMAEAEIKH